MAKRRSIDIDGFRHSNPIPGASVVGNLMMSSVIAGRDPSIGKVPASLEDQCKFLFQHVKSMVEAAGGSPDDIVKMTFFMKDPSQRSAINDEWVKMFPDEHSRPARHTQGMTGGGESLISCDFTAVLK